MPIYGICPFHSAKCPDDVKSFTYDYSYNSFDPASPTFSNQQNVYKGKVTLVRVKKSLMKMIVRRDLRTYELSHWPCVELVESVTLLFV